MKKLFKKFIPVTFALMLVFSSCSKVVGTDTGGTDTGGIPPVGDTIEVSGNTLAAKLAWVQSNAKSGATYLLKVSTDETISPQYIGYYPKKISR